MLKTSEWIGREVNGYTIVELIGSGSMADVFLARQPSMNRWVAVKVLSGALINDNQFVARFRQESQIVAAIEHPHILPVIDYGEHDSQPYMVMRYVSGGTLQDLLQRGPLSTKDVLRYLTEIGQGLDYAHSLGVVHRDVKPKNILLDTRGNSFISDFGLAKIVRGGSLTHSGVGMIGTPHYMSPEQGRGQPVDGRSDLYSLAVILYEMLTGRVPFDADSAVGIVMQHINDIVPMVTRANSSLPPALDAVLTRALAKEPEARFQSAHELIEAVAEAFGTTVVAGPVVSRPVGQANATREAWSRKTPSSWPGRPASQSSWPLLAVMGGVLALVGAFAVWGSSLFSAAPSQTPVATLTEAQVQTNAPTQVANVTGIAQGSPEAATATLNPSVTTLPTVTATPPPPTLTPRPGSTVVAQKDLMELVYIPAGEFLLGASESDPFALDDEKPQLRVYLDAYWIDRHEVTVAQFQDFVNATNYRTYAEDGKGEGAFVDQGGVVFSVDSNPRFVLRASWLLPEGPLAGNAQARPQRPVVQISWFDAQAYCEWAGRRLPTEAEWDKAARGTDGRIYPWGLGFDGNAGWVNFCDKNCAANWRDSTSDDKATRTSNVGSYPNGRSPYGVVDMSGNVWEWVADWYDFRGYYSLQRFSPPINPTGAEAGTERVVRGGSWFDRPERVRASARDKYVPDTRNNIVGFRCATSTLP